jgi:hypothetical protein
MNLILTTFFVSLQTGTCFIDSWMVVVNAKTMMIMMMIGFDDSFDDEEEKNNVLQKM